MLMSPSSSMTGKLAIELSIIGLIAPGLSFPFSRSSWKMGFVYGCIGKIIISVMRLHCWSNCACLDMHHIFLFLG